MNLPPFSEAYARPRSNGSSSSSRAASAGSLVPASLTCSSGTLSEQFRAAMRTDTFPTELRLEAPVTDVMVTEEPQIDSAELDSAVERSEVEEDLLAMNRIFEDELRKAAFRMADEDGVGLLDREQCRSLLRSLATTVGRKEAVLALKIPAEVDLDTFLCIADSFL